MNFSHHRTIGGLVSASIAGALLLCLVGCGVDVLTWAKDAKRQGLQEYNDGNYAQAAGSFRNAIRQDPTDPESEYWLALCYEQTQSYHEAIDAYRTCLSLMPPPGTAHYDARMHNSAFDRLAHIVARYDTTGQEADLIGQAATRDQSSEDYRLLGRVFRYRGDADTSLDDYRRATQLDPTNFKAQREFGLYLEMLGQNQEAGTVLRDAYRLNQNDNGVNAALRRIGMEPGDSLLVQNPPSRPLLPQMPTDNDDEGLTPAASPASPGADISNPPE
jgi:tetratricopeptide (TPR) repeat protein